MRHRRPAYTSNIATMLRTLLLAASACEPRDERYDAEQQYVCPTCGGGCSDADCGSNSPEIDGLGFHDLNLDGIPNSVGISIATEDGVARIYQDGVSYALEVTGSRLTGVHPSRPLLQGKELVGARIDLISTDRSYSLAIERAREIAYPVGDAETLEVYKLVWATPELGPHAALQNTCNRSSLAMPEGSIMTADETVVFAGDRIDARAKTMSAEPDNRWFNLGCAGHALAKLHLTRNTIASQGAAYAGLHAARQATLKMLAADYCGHGLPFTVTGQPLVWRGGHVDYVQSPQSLEARWSADGAVCLGTPRLEHGTLPVARAMFPDIRGAIRANCEIPRCTNLDPYDLAGSERISANP